MQELSENISLFLNIDIKRHKYPVPGNFQTLPSPTEHPIKDKTNSNLPPHCSRSGSSFVSLNFKN